MEGVHEMTQILIAHWGVILSVIYLIINVCNGITRHWSEHKGLNRVLGFIVEMLSMVTSYGSIDARFKLPLTSEKPKEEPLLEDIKK